jgi:thiol-disulfide isomerase/thioredoxin
MHYSTKACLLAAALSWIGAAHAEGQGPALLDSIKPAVVPTVIPPRAGEVMPRLGKPMVDISRPGPGLTVLEVGATWCEPCEGVFDSLIALSRAKPISYRYLSLSWDRDLGKLWAMLERKKYERIHVVADTAWGPTWDALPVTGVPSVMVVREDGCVVALARGPEAAVALLQRLGDVAVDAESARTCRH